MTAESPEPDPDGYKDRDTLARLKDDRGLSVAEIADRFDVSESTVEYWLQKTGIWNSRPKSESNVNVQLDGATHARVTEHTRPGDTLSATIDRALDALEREAALPDAVTAALREGSDATIDATGGGE
jgi:transposase